MESPSKKIKDDSVYRSVRSSINKSFGELNEKHLQLKEQKKAS
jgi:hypothetical protein